MERTQINSQSRLGPAQSRARVFSVFEQARVDEDAGSAALALGEIAGAGAEYVGSKEIENAEKEFEEGIVQGLINDGEQIRKGELEPSQSVYFQRGVAAGRSRAVALQIGTELNQRRREAQLEGNLPTDAEEYRKWREANLADIQANLGIDPSQLSGSVGREYAAGLMQVRQQDAASHSRYANERLMEEAYEIFDVELSNIWREGVDLDEAVQQTSELITSRRATGLDAAQLRNRAYSAVLGEAERTTNPELLEDYIASSESVQPPLLSQAQEAAMRGEIHTLRNRQRTQRRNAQLDAERAQDRIRTQALDEAAAQLYSNPYMAMPPSIVRLGEQAVREFNTLQSAMQNQQESSVDPAMQGHLLEQINTMSLLPGQGEQARDALYEAVSTGQITRGAFVSSLGQIESNQRAADFIRTPAVKDVRDTLDSRSPLGRFQGDTESGINRARLRSFDLRFSAGLAQWTQQNPGQYPDPLTLSEIANEAADQVVSRVNMDMTSGAGNHTVSTARQALELEDPADDGSGGESLPAPIPGGP